MEEMITSDVITSLKKENEQLKNRCFVLTRGSLCSCCPIKCECRQVQFGNDKQVEEKEVMNESGM